MIDPGRLSFLYVLVFLFLVWVIYLLVEIAKHVHAWPFATVLLS